MADFDEDKHPRDALGRWAEGAIAKAEAGEPSSIGLRSLGGGDWNAKQFSFGSNPGEKHLKTITLDEKTIGKPLAWLLGEGSRGVHAKLKELMGHFDVPQGHMVVYRLGAGEGEGLANRNGGNLKGVVHFVEGYDDKGIAHGNKLSAYLVKKPESYGQYTELTGKSRRGG